MEPDNPLPRVVIRGGGDLATGVACRLRKSGFPVVILELPEPRMIRSNVSFGQAVYSGEVRIEGVVARRVERPTFAGDALEVVVDPEGRWIEMAEVLVDARMLKHPDGNRVDQAPLVIGLGPGLEVGRHVHFVIETQRGHTLGQVIDQGLAEPDSGTPGELGGESARRLVRAPAAGVFTSEHAIGDSVREGDLLGQVDGEPVPSPLTGTLRGLLHSGLEVAAGEKLADVDPRRGIPIELISDKSRAIGGGVLEAIMRWRFGTSESSGGTV